jgi:hypothetical protein
MLNSAREPGYLLRYVLAVGPRAATPRFEMFTEGPAQDERTAPRGRPAGIS